MGYVNVSSLIQSVKRIDANRTLSNFSLLQRKPVTEPKCYAKCYAESMTTLSHFPVILILLFNHIAGFFAASVSSTYIVTVIFIFKVFHFMTDV